MKNTDEMAKCVLHKIEEHQYIKEKSTKQLKPMLCLGIVATMFIIMMIPNYINSQTEQNISNKTPLHIHLDNVIFNEIDKFSDAARRYYDPELYDCIKWEKEEILDYFGKDLTPQYIPSQLKASSRNTTTIVYTDKKGNIVEDTLWLQFYHDYYEDDSPMLTENIAAEKGFQMIVSKLGIMNDCVYIMPENEVKETDIHGTKVTFGYRSMPYGPYDEVTHEPSGYYDLYVAEFKYEEIEYQIITEQLELEEIVKIVSSIICEKSDY